MSTDTPVSFPAKLRAAYKLSKLATDEEKKLVLETVRQVMEDKASESWGGISFEKLNSITYLEVKDSVRTSSFTDAFNFATAMLTSEGVPKDCSAGRGDYFYWNDSE